MLSYELCKNLKDAGFPFREKLPEDFAVIRAGGKVLLEATIIDGLKCYPPTLSELIEACGGKFALHKNKTHWKAWQINSNPSEPNAADFEEIGSTPEEAVARLYLALHGNSTTEKGS